MIKQHYFPKNPEKRPGWLSHFAQQLPLSAAEMELDPEAVAAIAQDAAFLAYALGAWVSAARHLGRVATAATQTLCHETAAEPFILPIFTAPPLPDGVGPVPPGALQRIFAFVQVIKAAPGYTEPIGRQLGIIGAEAATEHPVPDFTLRIDRGDAGEWVVLRFFRYGRPGVTIHGRRGDGAWEQLAIVLKSPWTDKRPLLVPGQPEVREYRLQYYEGHAPVGDYTPIARFTVAP